MSETTVGVEEVEHVAGLARVDLGAGEAERFATQFAEILEHFEALDDVPEIEREADRVNVLRADEIRAGLTRAAALANAPETEDGYFRGPRVS